ncbi:MAG: sigma-70 family RNA polymerase sigma factor [Gemmatimonadota bacterium]|jgi:RNA polymerase sigma factor (sigma-70 family)
MRHGSPARLVVMTVMDFDSIFDQHYPPLVRYCHRLTGDADTAEDVAQESLVRLFDHQIHGSDAGVRAWLFKTATHLIRDRYRVRHNRTRLLAENPVTPSAPESPLLRLERSEARDRARAALDGLAPRDREILLMRYSGFSYREIAEAIDVAATSVGTLLSRAERRFADVMTEAAREAL